MAVAEQNVLEIRSLSVVYRTRPHESNEALTNVNLTLSKSAVIGLLGGSGSGKTTLGLAIMGLLPTNAHVTGSVLFRGVDLLQIREQEWQRVRGAGISMVFQEPAAALNPVIRVGEQIAEVIRAHSEVTAGAARRSALELVGKLRLDDPEKFYRAYPHELSGGQRQRICLAQALACRPSLIIADEPTAAVDASTQREMLGLMRDLAAESGAAILFITHEPSLLIGFAQRVAVLHDGELVEEGAIQDVLSRPANGYTRALLAGALGAEPGEMRTC